MLRYVVNVGFMSVSASRAAMAFSPKLTAVW